MPTWLHGSFGLLRARRALTHTLSHIVDAILAQKQNIHILGRLRIRAQVKVKHLISIKNCAHSTAQHSTGLCPRILVIAKLYGMFTGFYHHVVTWIQFCFFFFFLFPLVGTIMGNAWLLIFSRLVEAEATCYILTCVIGLWAWKRIRLPRSSAKMQPTDHMSTAEV